MTISKSIEILTDLLGEGPQFSPDDRREAVNLGIEALKREINNRINPGAYAGCLLPGETER